MPSNSEPAATTAPEEPQLFAHRGFAGSYPENTVAAVDRAAADGADAIEVDVQSTADGRVVVFHDETLARLTDAPASVAERPVWELPYDRIARYSVLGTDQSVPLLADVLAAIPPETRVNIELKNPGASQLQFADSLAGQQLTAATDRWRAFVGRLLDVAADHDHELLVSSFYEGALAATRELAPTVPVAPILWDSIPTGRRLAQRYDAAAIHPPWRMLIEPSTAEPPVAGPFVETDLIAVADSEGWTVNAWTVTTRQQAVRLRQAGVDGVIADSPDVCGVVAANRTENH